MSDLSKYARPQEIAEATAAFPTRVVGILIPKREELPEEFQKRWTTNPYCKFAAKWFFYGIDPFELRKDISMLHAMRHLSACLRSFEPSHEEKIGGVGYLLSSWGLVLPKSKQPAKKTKHNKTGKPKGKQNASNR